MASCSFIATTGIAFGIPNLLNKSSNLASSRFQQNNVTANQYVFVREWDRTGFYGYLHNPSSIAVDPTGIVYVVDTERNTINKFYSNGTFITKWGNSSHPTAIAVDIFNNVYVIDTDKNNTINKFTSDGKLVMQWGSTGSIFNGLFVDPKGIATDLSGDVFVADTGNDRIQKFHFSSLCPVGTDINPGICAAETWGSSGNDDGKFSSPTAIAVDFLGNVYVADSGNNRIQKFTNTGNFTTKWGSPGSGNGEFKTPSGLAVDSSGNVYVADTGNNRIQKFDSNGKFITKWGSPGSGTGQFNVPYAIAIDSSSGNVYVADLGNHRIQAFAPQK